MSSEITDILRASAREFISKSVPSGENGLEKSGITAELRKKLADQGFLNIALSPEGGGAGLEIEPYIAVLEEFSRVEPSIAMEIMLINSVAGKLLGHFEDGMEMLRKTASGEKSFIVSVPGEYVKNSVHSKEATLSGDVPVAVGGSPEYLIMNEPAGRTLLVRSGISFRKFQKPLGFRALSWGKVEIKDGQYEKVGDRSLENIFLSGINLEVSAIALGIAEGAIEKTIEYTKVRKVFNTSLKDFGPVASAMSRMKTEIELLRTAITSESVHENQEMIRHKSLELALNASRAAVQYHGGYGYFEAFGIEKLYRDSMTMKMMFGGLKQDLILHKKIYGSESGFL